MRVKILLCAMLALSLAVSYSQAEIDPDRIVGIWLLDEGKGDTAEDASENGREGTITNAKWAKGKFDGALEIKKGGTVTIPLGKGIIEDKVTFILVAKLYRHRGSTELLLDMGLEQQPLCPLQRGANVLRSWTNTWNVTSGVTVKAGTWYHVANVYDGETCKIYVDGEEKVSQKVPKFQLQDQDQTAWLATDKGVGFLSATIMDEVGLFNDGLTEDEVQGIMNDGILFTAFAVDPSEKLPVLWGKLKSQ